MIFFTSKFDQKAWTECLSGHGYNAITNANLVHQLATVLVEAKNDTNTGDQTIQDFIDIVHSPVKLMNMWKMVAHVLPIAVPATFLILLNREEYSTCKDDRYYKDLFWALPLAMAVFKGVFDMFLYPTELAVHKKDELGRFADRILGDGSGADPELGSDEERDPLIEVRVADGEGSGGHNDFELEIMPDRQATRTEQVHQGGRQQAEEIELTAVRLGTGGNGPVVRTGSEQYRDHQVTEPAELTGIVLQGVSGDRRGEEETKADVAKVEGIVVHQPGSDGTHGLTQQLPSMAESKSTTRLPTVNSKRFERNM